MEVVGFEPGTSKQLEIPGTFDYWEIRDRNFLLKTNFISSSRLTRALSMDKRVMQ